MKEVDAIIPTLQRNELRYRVVSDLPRVLQLVSGKYWDLNPGILTHIGMVQAGTQNLCQRIQQAREGLEEMKTKERWGNLQINNCRKSLLPQSWRNKVRGGCHCSPRAMVGARTLEEEAILWSHCQRRQKCWREEDTS